MSINDLFDSDVFLPMFFIGIVVVAAVAIPIGIKFGNQINANVYGSYEYGTESEALNAKIISKSTKAHPASPNILVNSVVFELTDGGRLEFAVKDADIYAVMVVGDCGTLKYQGKRFIDFERNKTDEI